MKNTYQTIEIHRLAPEKPAFGQHCNGCGVCCAAEPCPVSLGLLWPHTRPCRALEWNDAAQRYFCGMAIHPSNYLQWLPEYANTLVTKIVKRWIAANQFCDADVTFIHDAKSE